MKLDLVADCCWHRSQCHIYSAAGWPNNKHVHGHRDFTGCQAETKKLSGIKSEAQGCRGAQQPEAPNYVG